MKPLFLQISIFIIAIFTISCKQKADTELNSALARLAIQANYVTITGTARGPGVLKNAQVDVIALPSDGNCVNSSGKANGTSVGSAKTDSSGNYSVTYPRRSGLVCVVVTPTDGTTMTVSYAGKKDVSWSGKVNMTGIIREPVQRVNSITGKDITPPKRANITPFTRMVASRFGGARRIQARRLEDNLFLKAIHSVAPRAVAKTDEQLLEDAYTSAGNSFFTGLNTKSFKLEESNPDSPAYSLRLGGLAVKSESIGIAATKSLKLVRNYTRNTYNGNNISGDSIENLMKYMENDFSDGNFDGKKVNSSGSTENMSSTELSQVGLNSKSADNFLKSELTSNIKEYAKLNPDVNDNAYRSVRFCDPDDQSCSELSGDSAVFTYPEDGDTNVSPYPFFLVSFIEEVNTSTLIVQDTDGACTGTIQISNDNFQTCMGGTLDKEDPYFTMFFGSGTNEFQTNSTYKIKVTTSVRNKEGNPILKTNYQHSTGFSVADYLIDLGNGTVYDSNSYVIWARCPHGETLSGQSCTGTYLFVTFCNEQDNDCNGGFGEGTLLDGLITDSFENLLPVSTAWNACEALNTNSFAGSTSWRVPSVFELEVFGFYAANLSNFNTLFPSNYYGGYGLWSLESFDDTNAYYLNENTGLVESIAKDAYSIGVQCVSDDYPF
jgi:hypothetical protein